MPQHGGRPLAGRKAGGRRWCNIKRVRDGEIKEMQAEVCGVDAGASQEGRDLEWGMNKK